MPRQYRVKPGQRQAARDIAAAARVAFVDDDDYQDGESDDRATRSLPPVPAESRVQLDLRAALERAIAGAGAWPGDLGQNGRANARAFLAAFAYLGNMTAAADAAGVERNNHYYWMANLDGYADAFAVADTMAGERLEAEARRRAVEGIDRPIYQRGELVGFERVYSDKLMELLITGRMPDKYRRRISQEVSGPGGGPVPVAAVVGVADLGRLPDDRLAELAALAGVPLLGTVDAAPVAVTLPAGSGADGDNGESDDG